jgi:hypothetical protein
MDLFIVEHLHIQHDGEESVKSIGVYSSKEAAEKAVERLRVQPGFCDAPDGFTIDRYTLDKDHWSDGYFTVEEDQERRASREKGTTQAAGFMTCPADD